MNRRWIPWIVVAALVPIVAGWWWEVGRPQQQAFEVAEILSGRDLRSIAFDTGLIARTRRLLDRMRGRESIWLAFDRQKWAIETLQRLSQEHPAAVAHVARVEPSLDTRRLLVQAISGSAAYRSLPLDIRLDDLENEGIVALDAGLSLRAPQVETLRAAADRTVPWLHRALVDGHCGAIAGLSLVGDHPADGELARAMLAPDRLGRCHDVISNAIAEKSP